jgi:hypothetical protein
LAAVANELEISKVDLDPELVEAVERGAHCLRRVEVRRSPWATLPARFRSFVI